MVLDEIKKVAVLGAGTMGPGIAQCFAMAGYNVSIWSKDATLLPQAEMLMRSSLETMVEAGVSDAKIIEPTMDRVVFNDSLDDAIEGAHFITEAIIENLEIKKQLFKELDKKCSDEVIIASNTSYLNIFDIMSDRRKEKTVITHWFAPPEIIPLIEVVKGHDTSEETIQTVLNLLNRIGKKPILLKKYLPGFIINRLQRILGKEIFYMLDNDFITAEQLDLAVKASLAPRMMLLGLVQRYDFTGLDLSAKNIENGAYEEPPDTPQPKCLFDKVAQGELGVKSGKGFYDYSGRSIKDIMHERDVKLLQIFDVNKDLIN